MATYFLFFMDDYLHIPIVRHHCHFLQFVWQNKPYQWKVLSLGLAMGPSILLFILNLYFFFASEKAFVLLFT